MTSVARYEIFLLDKQPKESTKGEWKTLSASVQFDVDIEINQRIML